MPDVFIAAVVRGWFTAIPSPLASINSFDS